ncbi:hypothetical protein FAM09_19850 [Niastella caeni]|uniref:Lipocalin-like domain-containing protein n=1 Tax=Niastella caeni TaxID=2569763 RepID=A0A4S8HPL5_9BACT|nr:hypothetical protein [Niastella caeni]THU37205.1 hypothetical protein FAM09_19850 [Niastella caeni]
MWKYLSIVLILICQYHAHAQAVPENLLPGNWYVVRWETTDRLLDFQDTAASIKYMVDNFKQKNKLQKILREDSIRIRQELRKVLTAAGAIRFKLIFNKDKSFVWTNSAESSAQYKGTYSLGSKNQAIVLTSFDGLTKAYRTMSLKLHALQPDKMTIEIPSEEPGFKQSKFTLKKL